MEGHCRKREQHVQWHRSREGYGMIRAKLFVGEEAGVWGRRKRMAEYGKAEANL